MQVIILKTGELKNVAAGYARNHLFPHKLAVAATAAAQAQAETTRATRAAAEQAKQAAQAALLEGLQGQTVRLIAKANSSGTLFAAVHAADVATALAKIQLMVEPDQISFAPIKQVGDHTVKIKLPGHPTSTIVVTITPA